MKPGVWVPALEVMMEKILLGTVAGTAMLLASLATASAQITHYPGMCTGYSAPGECERCCARLAKGNSDCTNACRAGRPASDAKAMMSPKKRK